MASDVNPIIGFFRNETPDGAGRLLLEILAWHDDRLEYTHDYIQWLFPMRERSPVNPSAPVVDDETIAAFEDDLQLRESLKRAFKRMGAFYGFDCFEEDGCVWLDKSADWECRSDNWLTAGNHNMLRITRMITSLRLLGLATYAAAFFAELEAVYAERPDSIGAVTFAFWKRATRAVKSK